MGKRGPRPLPAALKKSRGTYQRCRDAPNALDLPTGVPTAPAKLDKAARAIWDELAGNAGWRVVLAKADAFGLELLVKHMALERRYISEAQRHPIIKTPFGATPNPAASEARKEAAIVKQLLAEFGLTPSARSRVSAPGGGKKDDAKEKAKAFLFGAAPLTAIPGGKAGA